MHGNINARVAANFERAINSFFSDKIFPTIFRTLSIPDICPRAVTFPGISRFLRRRAVIQKKCGRSSRRWQYCGLARSAGPPPAVRLWAMTWGKSLISTTALITDVSLPATSSWTQFKAMAVLRTCEVVRAASCRRPAAAAQGAGRCG